MQQEFIDAIHSLSKIQLIFFSKEDGKVITRLVAPMDFGPSRRARDKSDRYHFWDYGSDKENHVLSLLPDSIQSLSVINDNFSPAEFVTWPTNWIVSRDWGQYS